nr:7790_t:CDS:2 [Entrophospora candida]
MENAKSISKEVGLLLKEIDYPIPEDENMDEVIDSHPRSYYDEYDDYEYEYDDEYDDYEYEYDDESDDENSGFDLVGYERGYSPLR